ncbi:MAG: chloride channel protein [Limosilactobacillus sp.]|uniref:chloride channel protein n=1 Tax=Limosilactobacillus sp. TaxID=2773925 RepID=UPI00270C133D|nr:chloride channel protein [Limosilactobacillus sp.]
MKKTNHVVGLILATIALGIMVGVSSMLLSAFLDVIEKLFLGFMEHSKTPVASMVSPVRRLISVALGGLVAGFVWYRLQLTYKPTKIGQAIKGQDIPLGKTYVHVVNQIFFVATGNSIGRELAPREAGAAIAQKFTRYFDEKLSLTAEDQKLLIAAAAGAGFAGVYIAPLTGAIFCIELLYKKCTAKVVAISLGMSVIAMLIGSIVKGFGAYFYLPSSAHFSFNLIPLAIILGLVCGVCGTLFKKGVTIASKHRTVDYKVAFTLPLMSVITGLIAMYYPNIMGNGRGVGQFSFDVIDIDHFHAVTTTLLVLLVAKLFVTLGSIKFGAYGGILQPSIAAGSVIGIFAGVAYASFVPGVSLMQVAILGSTFFLTASQQAPFMASFMMIEICHLGPTAYIPIAIGVATSILTNKGMVKKFNL